MNPIPQLSLKQFARFWAKVRVRGPKDCWPWEASTDRYGYGLFWFKPSLYYVATRVAYRIATGTDPGKLLVCHECDNPCCCNPSHFFLGTLADNNADKIAKGRDPKGILNGRAKLTNRQVRDIRRSKSPLKVLAKRYGISRQHVGTIKARQFWKHLV